MTDAKSVAPRTVAKMQQLVAEAEASRSEGPSVDAREHLAAWEKRLSQRLAEKQSEKAQG